MDLLLLAVVGRSGRGCYRPKEETTRELCARMMNIPPLVQWNSKRIMRASMDTTLDLTMVLTSNAALILNSSEDETEARRAFVEKRKPEFKGR
jgi:1,4-dihydroxy-2-naphthoyl-CoA synthase